MMSRSCIPLLAFLLLSCRSVTPDVQERSLFPSANQTWWLMGSVFHVQGDSLVSSDHFLVTKEGNTGQCWLNTMRYQPDPTVSYQHMLAFDSVVAGRNDRFPLWLTMVMRGGGSKGLDPENQSERQLPIAGITLNRKRFVLYQKGGADVPGYSQRVLFTPSEVLPVVRISSDGSIFSLAPEVKNGRKNEFSELSITVFQGREDLLALARSGGILWLDLHLQGLGRIVTLAHREPGGLIRLLAANGEPGRSVCTGIVADSTDKPWISPVNGNEYFLSYRLMFDSGEMWSVRPVLNDQEIRVKGIGLWMGSVEVRTSGGGLTGMGTMCQLEL